MTGECIKASTSLLPFGVSVEALPDGRRRGALERL